MSYEGPLFATQGDPKNGQPDKRAPHKHDIRRCFHKQLKQLWATNRFLKDHRMVASNRFGIQKYPNGNIDLGSVSDLDEPMSEVIANLYRENGYRFLPLIREEMSLLCSLDILFLRRDLPGSVIEAGDLDNRIKTLIDALRRPKNGLELAGNETPATGEDPFYCLLEDDKLVTALRVETDTLLDPPTGAKVDDMRKVRLVITVDIKPFDITMFNLSFA